MNYIQAIKEDKVYPVIRGNDERFVSETARALTDGGIRVLEINIGNPANFRAIKEVSKYTNVCAGGIITSTQAEAALECGAKLISSPIFQMNMVKFSKNKRVYFIAGASTPNEAYNAWKTGIPLIKLYPAAASGGSFYIEDILRQMPFLSLMPMGSVKLNEIPSYIKAGAAAVGIGRDFYLGHAPKEITRRAREILKEMRNFSVC